MPLVDVVVVNWNAGDQIVDCLRSLRALEASELASVTVVDNGSADGSDLAVEALPGVTLIRSGGNVGFGRACNIGAARGAAPFILLLNPDTRLIEPCIAPARAFLQSPEGAGFGMCGVRHVDDQGHTARHTARFPTPATFIGETLGLSRLLPAIFPPLHVKEFDHLTSRTVDHVMAAFVLIRREAYDAVGGFDPDYFVYLEDLDLSKRLSAVGWRTFYLATATIFHRGGGTSASIRARALFYVLDARFVYVAHHFGPFGRSAVRAATLLADPFTRSFFHAVNRDFGAVTAVWRAHAMLWKRLLRGRRVPPLS